MTEHRGRVDLEGMARRAVVIERERREESGEARNARFNALNLRNIAARLEELAGAMEKKPKAAALAPLLEERYRLAPELERLADLLEEYAAGELVDRRLGRTWCETAEFARGLATRMPPELTGPKQAKRYAALVEETAEILEAVADTVAQPSAEESQADE